ncbi:hypothetical protein KO566_06170 [Flavobacteriaceae bacterium XHP0103]|uniref:hypothetical protein n=1 Tax=Marixanthotalea marina TaxID=2844359 RepID=UPI002989ABC1|nr:hypothetical protein [Marixanthotalea marina]MBU3821638.1 hypothetical protein [Marixanthotalea marina]
MVITNKPSIIGLVLLLLYFFQFFFNIKWEWLGNLQITEMYKRWSGLVLAIFILFQWALTFTRIIKRLRKYAMKMVDVHKWLGAISPVLFYVHSINAGYGYLSLLTYLFFANALLGYVNLDVIKSSNELLFKGWMIFHVLFSIVITVLTFFHIGVVFYYK